MSLTEYYTELINKFYNYLVKVAENHYVEDIHQLRVSVKKLRAAWVFFEMMGIPSFNKKEYMEAVKNLFKNAGYLREIQINLILVEGENKIEGYKNFLRNKAQTYKKQLVKVTDNFEKKRFDLLNSLLFSKLMYISQSEIVHTSDIFIEKTIRKVRKLYATLPEEENMHKIRIYLKMVAEVYFVLNQTIDNERTKKNADLLKSLNEKIGNWHDYFVLQLSFEDFVKRNDDEKYDANLQYFLRKIVRIQEKKQQKLAGKIKNRILKIEIY